MRIDILAIGSRGDVQPCVALGLALQRAGHCVRVVTLGGFDELVRGSGLEHLSIGDSPQQIAASADGQDWIKKRQGTVGFLRGFTRLAESRIEKGIAGYWPAAHGVEALIGTTMGLLIAMHVAERLQVPMVRVSFAPSRHDWAVRSLEENLAAIIWASCRFLMWRRLRAPTNAARARTLALPPLPKRDPLTVLDHLRVPILDAYSSVVIPKPPHWDDWIHVTGYWFLDSMSDWQPSSELSDFLVAGPPPVFVGFGSTPFPEPEAATAAVVDALKRVGHRGIIVAGSSGLPTGRLSTDVLSVDAVPHAWLFTRVSAAVHHGGAGVTHAALRAGLPSVIVPVFGDQPLWARRVFQLGAAAPPVPAKRLTADTLAAALRLTAGNEMRRRAAALGERMGREDGPACAVRIIEDYVAAARAS